MKKLLLLACVIAIIGCSSDTKVTQRAKSNAEMRDLMIGRIDSMETAMRNADLQPDDELMANLLRTYVEFSERYPADVQKTPELLYKAAALARGVELPVKAIKFYDKILTDFPNWEKAPEVAFLNAFTYDEDLKAPDLAKEAYEEVISKYPGDKWAIQAKQRMATIDMSDEELIEFLKKKQTEGAEAN